MAAASDGFDSFYADSYRRLVSHVFALVGNLPDAEELAQEAYARALVRWQRLRDYDQPEAWVRRVAFNLAASRLARARRGVAALARYGPPGHQPAMSVDSLALTQALARLPVRYRHALVLHYLVGLPVEQVAAELGQPTGTVKTHLARGRRALASVLGDDADAAEPAAAPRTPASRRAAGGHG
jgi:RNA polymerase sigma-70 factor (ECF subfamily)